jgi:hypothetical protein
MLIARFDQFDSLCVVIAGELAKWAPMIEAAKISM